MLSHVASSVLPPHRSSDSIGVALCCQVQERLPSGAELGSSNRANGKGVAMLSLIRGTFDFGAGLFVGFVVLYAILPAWLYGVPRSLALAMKGQLHAIVILYYAALPILWLLFFGALALIARFLAPSLTYSVLTSEAFAWGVGLALTAMVFNSFTANGRAALAADFDALAKRLVGKQGNSTQDESPQESDS